MSDERNGPRGLKEKYPKARYDPDPDCPQCGGRGEWYDSLQFRFFKVGWIPCECIFFGPDFAPVMRKILVEAASQALKELGKTRESEES